MEGNPKVSIIIPAWNESSVLPSLLNSLSKLNYPLKKIELILVAGGSDDTLSSAREFKDDFFEHKVVIEQKPGMGKSQAIIEGLKAVSKEIIVLVDADCVVERGWLTELVNALKNGYDAVSGNCYPIKKNYTAAEAFKRSGFSHSVKHKIPTLNGMASIAFKRSILDKHGIETFFNKDFIANDDVLFLLKLKEKGFKVGMIESSRIYSHYPKTFKDFIKESIRWRHAWFQLSQATDIHLKNAVLHSSVISLLPWAAIFSFTLYFIYKRPLYLTILLFSFALLLMFVVKVFKITNTLVDEDPRYRSKILWVVFLHWVDHNILVLTVLINSIFKSRRLDTNFKGPRQVD